MPLNFSDIHFFSDIDKRAIGMKKLEKQNVLLKEMIMKLDTLILCFVTILRLLRYITIYRQLQLNFNTTS